MTDLATLQQNLARYILAGDLTIESQINSTNRVASSKRLAIYADAYRLRLLEALSVDFPGLQAVLNEEFSVLGYEYIAAHPSSHYSLRYFGHLFDRFLQQHSLYKAKPWLAELASFELALRTAFDAADRPTCTAEEAAAVPGHAWPSMRIELQPSLQILNLHWNVVALWQAANDRQSLPEPEQSDVPVHWLVWRQDLRVYFRSLGAGEYSALNAVSRNADFASVCDVVSEALPEEEVPGFVAGSLRAWIEAGLVTSMHY